MEYRFTFEGREYKLNKENLDYFINDEENPIKNIDLDKQYIVPIDIFLNNY